MHSNWGRKIWKSVDVKLLGVTIDKELTFDKYVTKIYSTASRKLKGKTH